MINSEPSNIQEALDAEDSYMWIEAMDAELNSLRKNKTWILVDKPNDKNIITNRWVFRKKLKADRTIDKFKAHLVARGFSQ